MGATVLEFSTPFKREPAMIPDHVVKFLSGGQICVVSTVDADGRPSTSLMTWVVARDERTLALAVGNPGRAYTNIVERKFVAVEVLGDGVTIGLRGRAEVLREKMAKSPFPSALVVVTVDEVKDHAARGVEFRGPSYTFADDKQHRYEVEREVFRELREG